MTKSSSHTPHSGDNAKLVDFGDQLIPASEKQQRVNDVFHSVASSYDMMNDVMVVIHRLWKDQLMNMITPEAHHQLVDLAGGTGDISARFLQRGGKSAVICDINTDMMLAGRGRPDLHRYGKSLQWLAGDASALPLMDDSADIVTISFGLRNVTDRDAALRKRYTSLSREGSFLSGV